MARRGQAARDVAGFALLGAGATLFLGWRFSAVPPALGSVPPYDLMLYFVPMLERAASRLASGELPLWSREGCSGMPLLATLQVAVFHPTTWLALALPAERALVLGMALHGVLGACGMALFARASGASRLASAAGAVLFVYGLLVGQTFWPPSVATLAWLPWVLLGIARVARGGGFGAWVGLAAATALQLLAGFPQFVLYTAYLAAPYALLCLLDRPREVGRARPAVKLAAAALLGAGLAAVQLLPTAELVGESARAGRLAAEDVRYRVLERALTLDGFARNTLDPSPKLPSVGYGLGAGYLGLGTLVWLAVALSAPRRRAQSALWLGLGVVSLLLSFGPTGPAGGLHALYAALPGGSTFRDPERLRAISVFCAIALAVAGLDRLREALRSGEPRTALVVAGAVTIALFALRPLDAAWRVILPLAALAASARFARKRTVARALAAGVLLALLVDVGLATERAGSLRALPAHWVRTLHSLDGRVTLDASGLAAVQAAAGEGRIASPGFDPTVGAGPLAGWLRTGCYEPLAPAPWVALQRRIQHGGPVLGLLDRLPPDAFPTLYDVTSTTVVVEPHREMGWALRANPDAMPRAYVVATARVAPARVALERLLDGGFDFRRAALVEVDVGLGATTGEAPLARPARITLDRPERVVVAIDGGSAPGLLVLTDTFYPGWVATVDGAPARIVRVNGAQRGVRVAPGPHEVVFAYRPWSVRAGAAISLASLGVLASLGLARLRRPARRGEGRAPARC